jgi:hypothetical protein
MKLIKGLLILAAILIAPHVFFETVGVLTSLHIGDVSGRVSGENSPIPPICPKGFAKYVPEKQAFCPCVFWSEYKATKNPKYLISTQTQKLALGLE